MQYTGHARIAVTSTATFGVVDPHRVVNLDRRIGSSVLPRQLCGSLCTHSRGGELTKLS
jgi:hypothetical protein